MCECLIVVLLCTRGLHPQHGQPHMVSVARWTQYCASAWLLCCYVLVANTLNMGRHMMRVDLPAAVTWHVFIVDLYTRHGL
jgi:hypothetical protein